MANFSLFITYLSLVSLLLSRFCRSFNPKRLNVSEAYQLDSGYYSGSQLDSSYYSDSHQSASSYYSGSDWTTAYATWYGGPDKGGSDGGSCGYGNAVESAPFNALITATAPSLYQGSLGCGKCYQVKCTASVFCSGNPVTVVATDSCPGCDHPFDLSGVSFGAMAIYGDAGSLRNVGRLEIQYKSVECNFGVGVMVTFRVQPGSSPYYLAFAVEFEDGHGISGVDVMMKGYPYGTWIPMSLSWGAIFMVSFPHGGFTGPISVRLTDGPQTIVAENAIPANYAANVPYVSSVNFHV